MKCQSCAMPMEKQEDFGGGNMNNNYCKHCALDGTLKGRDEIREGWTLFVMKTEKLPKEEAQKEVDEAMAHMSVWK